MNNTITYRGYTGSVEFSAENNIFYGKVLGVCASISYKGYDASELLDNFHRAIDDYYASCTAQGITPEKPYKGSFNVRIGSELHQRAALTALQQGSTLNAFVERAICQALSESAQ